MKLKDLTYAAILTTLTILFMVYARAVLIPTVFAILLALSIAPIANFFEHRGASRLMAAIYSYIGVTLLIGIGVTIITVTFVSVYQDLPDIRVQLEKGIQSINNLIGQIPFLSDQDIGMNLKSAALDILKYFWSFLEKGISGSIVVVGNVVLVFIFVFLLLLYRGGIKAILLMDLSPKEKEKRTALLENLKNAMQHYALGLFVVIIILGVLNSFGLWIIGIDYPVFWGFLAALLVIIPFIGTTLGGTLPFLYALATTSTLWQPLAIVIMYVLVQQLEGNFITPNIVGSQIQVNVLVILVGMIAGGLIWGIAGLILVVPMIGIIKIFLLQNESTKKLGLLMSDDLIQRKGD